MRAAREIGTLLAAKIAVGMLVLASGFRAVSDDDFARVVLAQQWASEPKLDPTGTSWLPAPFWIYGAVMKWAGPSLEVARVTALLLGLASVLLLYAAARLLIEDRRAALWGALVASVLPWSARLGVATVPELPTAALTLFAVATLTRNDTRLRLWGAAALTVACLSRYEPWLVAAIFAGLSAWQARPSSQSSPPRPPSPSSPRKRQSTAAQRGLVLSALLALLGPASWLIHNAVSHGSALHFLDRVSAYKKAVGGVPASIAALLEGYPLSLLREEPEICLLALALFLAAKYRRQSLPACLGKVALILGGMLLLLTVAALPGGAPTHHAGRALLVLWLAMAIFVGAAARGVYATPGVWRWGFALLLLTTLSLGTLVLRPWYARLDSFTPRFEETTIGAAATKELARPSDSKVLLEVVDYGFFAVQAGSGQPGVFVLDREIDPRQPATPSSFTSMATLEIKLRSVGPDLVVARLAPAPRLLLGEPLVVVGRWGLWRVADGPGRGVAWSSGADEVRPPR